jgi:Fe2+ or Zn2+ uptake regulation protein
MSTVEHLITNLKNTGERITAVRTAVLAILTKEEHPLSVQDLLNKLAKRHLRANKTTVYRQLETLTAKQIVREIRFADRTVRYELARDNDHHHHLVCLNCGKTEDISFKEDIERQEKSIMKQKKFKVLEHSLEFFGLCHACQKKKKR